MPRRINKKCLGCAQLDANEAIDLHGPEGDGCWDPKRCPRKRSHYRHRQDTNAKRRGERAAALAGVAVAEGSSPLVTPEVIELQGPVAAVAYLYLYRDKRQDAPLHALSIAVWKGPDKIAELPAIHCGGLRNRQVQDYLQKAIDGLKERYGIYKFEPEVRMEAMECPLRPCPLHPTWQDQL
jgi:hypothetical protein